jgi:exo-beta-1,3-glucanase (GH17 family)
MLGYPWQVLFPSLRWHMPRALLLIVAFVLTSLATYGGWGLHGRPQAMPDVPDGKMRCTSYAPYRDGQSPFIEGMVIPAWQIDEDLAILSKRFDCVRTYSVNQGLDQVPAIAAKYGMKVLLGIWINKDLEKKGSNEKEISVAANLANEPSLQHTIMAVIVGNEVLLRREQTAQQMTNWIKKVKAQVSVPVTYADVWEFWLKNPSVAEAVDYMTVHILPYWEDEPQSIDQAMAHLRDILARMRAAFPGKPLFIGETGWPSAGRTREGAVPSRANQARYIREFIRTVGQEKVDYNVIESFDQPWKRIQEGTVGGHWGIFDADRKQKFPFTGPVSDNPRWRIDAATGMTVAAIFLGVLASGGYGFGFLGWLAAAAAAQAAGAILMRQWLFIADTSHNLGTWLVSFSGLVLSCLAALLLLITVADYAAGRRAGLTRPASIVEILSWLKRPRYGFFDRALTLGLLQFFTLFGATAVALQLLIDPRYRDFPTATYLIPAAGFALLAGLQDRKLDDRLHRLANHTEERWLACMLAVAALISGVREGFMNWESLGWMATALVVALPWLRLAKARLTAGAVAKPVSPGAA